MNGTGSKPDPIAGYVYGNPVGSSSFRCERDGYLNWNMVITENPFGFLSGAVLPNAGLIGDDNLGAVAAADGTQMCSLSGYGSFSEGHILVNQNDPVAISFSNPDEIDKVLEVVSMYISDSVIKIQPVNQNSISGSFEFVCVFETVDSSASWNWEYSDNGSDWSVVVDDPPGITTTFEIAVPLGDSLVRTISSVLTIEDNSMLMGRRLRLSIEDSSRTFKSESATFMSGSSGSSSSSSSGSSSSTG